MSAFDCFAGRPAALLAIAASVSLYATQLRSDHLFILDASASMGQPLGKEARSEIAKRIIREAIEQSGAEPAPGLLAYGTKRKGDCQDWTLLAPPARGQAAAISEILNEIRTIGKAPLGAAIGEAVRLASAGAINRAILITDGADNCGVDACAKLETLPPQARLTIDVIDLGAPLEDQGVLICLAEQSGGVYRRHEGTKLYADGSDETTPVAPTDQQDLHLPVPVIISSGTGDPVEWSAIPLDHQSVEAMATPEPVTGDFETSLEPGRWEVRGSAHAFGFYAVITVTPADRGKVFTIPAELESEGMADDGEPLGARTDAGDPSLSQPEGGFAIRNDSRLPLSFADPITGLAFVLPPSWAIDTPYRDEGAPPYVGFYATSLPSSFPNIALNPIQWTGGPCLRIAAGDLCHDNSPETLAALETIRDSLREAGQ